MLLEFRVSNFLSFADEQVLSLVANNYEKGLAEQNTVAPGLPGLTKVKVLKGAAVYGANASGKSNLLRAVSFMARLVRDSAVRLQPGEATGVTPFKLDGDLISAPSRFEATFVAEGIRYRYFFALTANEVVEEGLDAYPKGRNQMWFRRRRGESDQQAVWEYSSPELHRDESLEAKTRDNALFLSTAAQFNHPRLGIVYRWFQQNVRFLNMGLPGGVPSVYTGRMIEEDADTKATVLKLMQAAELGIDAIEAKREFVPVDPQVAAARGWSIASENGGSVQAERLAIEFLRQSRQGELVRFDLDREVSNGTRRFFAALGPWLDVLQNGRVLFVDEIETSLHPLLVRELIQMHQSHNREGLPSQLIFTTHSPLLLDREILRRDQVWFTEKDHGGATRLYPLTDFMPRKDEALSKGYLAGRYGGIPFIPARLGR